LSLIRVLIADDHELTLAAVRAAVQEDRGVRIVAEANSGRAALAAVQRSSPDVVLLDMHMPGAIDGPTCAERIRGRFPGVRVVMFSGFTDEASIRMAFRRGAHAFISKAVDPGDIAPALRLAASDTVYHAPPDGGPLEAEDLAEGLSEREATVLKAVAAGLSNQAIAKRLWVTEHTVKFHLTNIFRKLDVSNRTEAARWAHKHGIVEDGVGGGAETDEARAAGKAPAAGKAAARATTVSAVA
jgi:NarL family two-component system response regulator LiaR